MRGTSGGGPVPPGADWGTTATAARPLGLAAAEPVGVWERRVRWLVARSGLADAAVRLTITRGTAGEGLAPEGKARPTLLLTARRLPAPLAPRPRESVPVILLPFPRAPRPPWGGLHLGRH